MADSERNAGASSAAASERQLVTFFLGREEFGTDIMHVREIVRLPEVTAIPQAPAYVKGVANLRGTVLPVIDGRALLEVDCQAQDENTRVLVVDVHGAVTGIIVDKVAEVIRVASVSIDRPPQVLQSAADGLSIDGIVKLDNGKRIIMILEMASLLDVGPAAGTAAATAAAAAAAACGPDLDKGAGEKEDLDEDQLVTFTLAGEEYAFNIMQVKEIIRAPEITRIPNAVDYIEGVVSLRNELLPIVNMRSYFRLPEADITDSSRVIVVDIGALPVGFRVDRVQEVTRVDRKVIEPPPVMYADCEKGYFRGIAKLNRGDRLLMYLDAQKLLSAEVVRSLSSQNGTAAAGQAAQADRAMIHEEQLVTFRLGKEEFAVPIKDVQEVNRMSSITHMPGTPSYVEGLVNLRGNIIPALNLRRRFGLASREIDDATRIIIVDINNRKTGLIVDAVSEVLRIEKSFIEKTPESMSGSIDSQYVSGIAKLNGGQRMVLILDLAAVVAFSSQPQTSQDKPAAKTDKPPKAKS